MINTKVTVTDQATPYLAKALAEMERKQPIHQAMAEGAAALVQRHFAGLAVTNRNRFGVRGGFWQRMLAGTKGLATDTYAYVQMPRPVALRYFGGTVNPVRTKYLAIPARAEAHNKSPRDFNDLRFVPTKGRGKGGMLVRREQSRRGTKQRSGGEALYFLVRSVTVRRDESVLPTFQDLAVAASQAGEGFIRRRLGIV